MKTTFVCQRLHHQPAGCKLTVLFLWSLYSQYREMIFIHPKGQYKGAIEGVEELGGAAARETGLDRAASVHWGMMNTNIQYEEDQHRHMNDGDTAQRAVWDQFKVQQSWIFNHGWIKDNTGTVKLINLYLFTKPFRSLCYTIYSIIFVFGFYLSCLTAVRFASRDSHSLSFHLLVS